MKLKSYIKGIFNPKTAKAVRRAKAKKKAGKLELKKLEKRFENLEANLKYKFSDKNLLKQALTHPGAINSAGGRISSNQRLEFLGDAVLQVIISDEVYRSFPDREEGELTKARIALTRGSFLADLSEQMKIPECLILPKGCESLRKARSAWEDSFEAIVGAIYMDSNFDTAKKVVLGWYGRERPDIDTLVVNQNPKGSLQEAAVKNGDKVSYELIGQSGPDHDKKFESAVLINGKVYASASASSKKHAESQAAALALKKYLDEHSKSQ